MAKTVDLSGEMFSAIAEREPQSDSWDRAFLGVVGIGEVTLRGSCNVDRRHFCVYPVTRYFGPWCVAFERYEFEGDSIEISETETQVQILSQARRVRCRWYERAAFHIAWLWS